MRELDPCLGVGVLRVSNSVPAKDKNALKDKDNTFHFRSLFRRNDKIHSHTFVLHNFKVFLSQLGNVSSLGLLNKYDNNHATILPCLGQVQTLFKTTRIKLYILFRIEKTIPCPVACPPINFMLALLSSDDHISGK